MLATGRRTLWSRRNPQADCGLSCAAAIAEIADRSSTSLSLDMQYSIKDFVGFSGTSTLHKAMSHSDGTCVCVKRPLPEGEQISMGLLQTELDILMSISHPNIVQTFGLVADGPRMSLVTEYIPNRNLHQLVINSSMRSLDEHTAQGLFVMLFQGIAHLHSNNICHRDVNPHNALVSHDGKKLKLSDFGRARRYDTSKNLRDWMSAQASDVWGGGPCLHYMLSGQLPCISSKGLSLSDVELSDDVLSSVSPSCTEVLHLSLNFERGQGPAASKLLQLPWLDLSSSRWMGG